MTVPRVMIGFIPKTLKNLIVVHRHDDPDESTVTIMHPGLGHFVLTVKKKSQGSVRFKIGMKTQKNQLAMDKFARDLLAKLYPEWDMADQGAMSGGMLYECWQPKTGGTKASMKMAIKHLLKRMDEMA